jgi:predicted secreted protein
MAAQSGKDLLIKVDLDGTGLFETIAGLRATRLSSTPRRWMSPASIPRADGASCWAAPV